MKNVGQSAEIPDNSPTQFMRLTELDGLWVPPSFYDSVAEYPLLFSHAIKMPLILLTYPLKPLLLLMGDAVVAAEFSVDNVKSVMNKE